MLGTLMVAAAPAAPHAVESLMLGDGERRAGFVRRYAIDLSQR